MRRYFANRNFIALLLAAIYRVGYILHHKIFLRKKNPLKHAKLIVIGSFRIGGAGKTPFCLWLATELCKNGNQVAVLCHKAAFDEFELLKKHLPKCRVVKTGNRYKTASALDMDFDYILCDDGFEDSRLTPFKTFRLDWGTPPTRITDLFPAGVSRSLVKDHQENAVPIKCDIPDADIHFSICKIQNEKGQSPIGDCVAITGLGNPERFFKDLEFFGIKLTEKIKTRDHDRNFSKKIEPFLEKSQNVIITEKDAMRLNKETLAKANLFVAYQETILFPNVENNLMKSLL